MIEVVGISFIGKSRIYYFSPNNLEIKKGDNVIVETDRGQQFAKVVTDIASVNPEKLKAPLKNVIKIADEKDIKTNEKNKSDALKALDKCKEMVRDKNLNMKIIDAYFTFDRDQLVFQFVSDNRIDFRELARDLATIYKTRIELRQVGVRDKAKEIGGIGPCGRPFCCSKFLKDFDTVSINMAKNQNISLNPNKINGVCGRLLCCLNYEDECYKECKKGMPDLGKRVKTASGEGKVVSLDILKRKYKVDIPQVGIVEIEMDKDGSN